MLHEFEMPTLPLSGEEAVGFLGELCSRIVLVLVCAYDQEGYLLAARIGSGLESLVKFAEKQ